MPKSSACLLLTLALAALMGAGCRADSSPLPANAGAPRPVTVAAVRSERPRISEALPAELSAYQDVMLQARVAGFIRRLYADRGSRVASGQLLAELEAPDLVAQRAEAEHRLGSARALRLEASAALERDQVTLQRLRGAAAAAAGAVAGNDIHVAEQTVAADQAEVSSRQAAEEAAQEMLKSQVALEGYLRVVAPFRGVVVRRGASEGALAGPSAAPLFELQQLDPLRLVIDVPEAEAVGMQLGLRLPFTVSSQPGRRFEGTVARIAHSVRRETRTMPIELDVANPDLALAPGMFAHVAWSFQREDPTLFVPIAAVLKTSERSFVEVVGADGALRWVDVTTGFSHDGELEVFAAAGNPLQPGDRAVVPGDDELRPGQRVAAIRQP
ncbi:MAG TPA: efflux RND transporter periplasmic adaptor subunit [Terriglobales bacterium]|nr:efflux RND transporter periplasmic adaptor subunit [Terriglobales bacterium]HVA64120.1 efflux RND transporter periplasmic adaptor subunit [Terriglobales bacterium]